MAWASCVSDCVSPQPGPSPTAKCLVLALHSSGCLWLVRDLGQRVPLLSLLLGRAELCGVIRSGPMGLQALRRGYFTISRPKGGFVMICFSNCWFPSQGPAHIRPPTEGRPPCSSSSRTSGALRLPSCGQRGLLRAPTVRQWPHYCFRGLPRHCQKEAGSLPCRGK